MTTKEANEFFTTARTLWTLDESVEVTELVMRGLKTLEKSNLLSYDDAISFLDTLPNIGIRGKALKDDVDRRNQEYRAQFPVPNSIPFGQLKEMRRDRGF